MIKLAKEQPLHITVQVNIQVNVWLCPTSSDIPKEKPIASAFGSLGRSFPYELGLDNQLATVIQMDEMSEHVIDNIASRIVDEIPE